MIDEQILKKVIMLSDLLASEAFILLPNEILSQKSLLPPPTESLQEVVAANISKSVFNHLKAFKNAKRSDGSAKDNGKSAKKADSLAKDTHIGEMMMYFLFKIGDFENRYLENQN